MNEQTAYPLSWPAGWPRTKDRERARFKTTLSAALNALKIECTRLGGINLVLSSNCTLGDESPAECGVVAYFTLDGKGIAIPCDRWNTVRDNVKAIALTIEALRGMDRWGAKHMITAMFTGFIALPEKTELTCWEYLGINQNQRLMKKHELEKLINDQFKACAFRDHPDHGGTPESFARLQQARDIALASIR